MTGGGILSLPAAARAAILRHAEAAYPEECCGILVGAGGEVRRAVAADNVHRDRRRHYTIAPEALLEAQRAARAEGFDLIGYYHSHPGRAAAPSEHDRRDAWPGVSYLIVSVGAGAAGEVRSWRLDAEAAAFVEQPVETGAAGAPEVSSRPARPAPR